MNTQPKAATEVAIIAAVARNGAIGRGNALLFNEPADQRHFRATTLGCPVVMGRKTWDSLPPRFRPLPGRRNLVLSRDPAFAAAGAETAPGLEAALARLQGAPRVFVIGGAQVYAAALPLAHKLVLTEIDADLDGDVHFPAWDRSAFVETDRRSAVSSAGLPYHFVTYERKAGS
jgi:dihydrofolate reductase